MKKVIALSGSVVSLGLLALTVAIFLGFIGPPGKEQLPARATRAVEDYCALVADVRKPEDVKAVEAQELQLRRKAIDASTEYLQAAVRDKAPRQKDQETFEKFQPLLEKFRAEVKRYEGLRSTAASDRPRP
jgi:hypothetical protein